MRHMMVTFVRGHFKDIHGTLVFDPANPGATSVEATIESAGIWTGEAARDDHLRSADFLDVKKQSEVSFRGKPWGNSDHTDQKRLSPRLTIRGITRTVPASARPSSRTVADSMVGRRNGQGTESQGRLYRQRHDQSPRLRRELEQHFRQRWRRRRQHSRDHDRRRSDPARRMIVHCLKHLSSCPFR